MKAEEGNELVGVAYANDRVEAEMIQGLLESAGIPSALQHVGIDGPRLEAEGRKTRDYSLLGAYGRAWTVSVGILILAFAVFLLQREI